MMTYFVVQLELFVQMLVWLGASEGFYCYCEWESSVYWEGFIVELGADMAENLGEFAWYWMLN